MNMCYIVYNNVLYFLITYYINMALYSGINTYTVGETKNGARKLQKNSQKLPYLSLFEFVVLYSEGSGFEPSFFKLAQWWWMIRTYDQIFTNIHVWMWMGRKGDWGEWEKRKGILKETVTWGFRACFWPESMHIGLNGTTFGFKTWTIYAPWF
jgi:hypothetical protein